MPHQSYSTGTSCYPCTRLEERRPFGYRVLISSVALDCISGEAWPAMDMTGDKHAWDSFSERTLAVQVVDEQQGPTTKREYDVAKVPVGDELAGKVVDFLGRAPGTQVQLGTSAFAPLFGEQPDMESREQIAEALVTGVKVRHHQLCDFEDCMHVFLHRPCLP